jgi:uncharacterized protein with ParB-like and HNH nuclease domain
MELQNLTEIFNNKVFRIPDYQRGYAWKNPQLEDLWQDLNILEEETAHYTGMLSVKKYENNTYFIVDGQQRITSLIIAIKEICTKLSALNVSWVNEKEVSDYEKIFLHRKTGEEGKVIEQIFGYQEDNPSHIYFRTKILEISSTDDSTPDDTVYTNNLKNAKKFFEEKLKNKAQDSLEVLLKKITEQLKFNFYKIESELNEFVAFETMNNRGKPLTTLELLKNRLIYLSTLLPQNDEKERELLREDINNVWKTIYEYLGKNPNKEISDDDFLQDHWIMNFQYDRKTSKVYKTFLLDDYFTAKKVISFRMHAQILENGSAQQQQLDERPITFQKIQIYVKDMQKAVKHYYYLHNPTDTDCNYSDSLKTWLTKLNRLSFGAFKPAIMAMLVRNVDDEKITEVLQEIERFIFIEFNLYHRQRNYKNTTFYSFAKTIHVANDDQLSTKVDDLLNAIQSLITKDNLAKTFTEAINKKEEKYYKWNAVKYFLYEYELSLQEKARGDLKVEWEHINSDSIEHIYPQTATNECWTNKFPNKDCLHDLGNLLLLSRRVNSELQNKCFNDKKERFSKNSYSAIAVSKFEDWTPETIQKRKEKMLTFLDERWDTKICTELNESD